MVPSLNICAGLVDFNAIINLATVLLIAYATRTLRASLRDVREAAAQRP